MRVNVTKPAMRLRQSGEKKPAGTYLGVVRAVLLLVAVPTDCVIIEAGIFDESHPLAPPRRNVAAVVLVQVLPEEGCEEPRRRTPSNTKKPSLQAREKSR